MKALTFTIELLEPLLATGLEGDPNAGVSLKYVPGSVLRGAVIGLYLRDKKAKLNLQGNVELELSNDSERNLFFNGRVLYLNAYPQSDGNRSLPTPLSWQKEKDTDAHNAFCDFNWRHRDNRQYKDLGSPFFVFLNSATIVKVNPETTLAVHTQRDAKKGRSTSDEGAVFRYESVVAGTNFCGATMGDETLLEEIKGLIDNKQVLLGGSRTAGYGRARIVCAQSLEVWNETSKAKAIKKGDEFTITLLSNALIRDLNGQFQGELVSIFDGDGNPRIEIESIFSNCRFEELAEIISDKTFKRVELVGGFNRKWGLPLPQQLSIKAGSSFKFRAKEDIEESTVQKWLDEGAGERRVEGFGRIALNVNSNSNETLSFRAADEKKVSAMNLTAQSDTAQTLGKKIIARILRQNFEKAIIGAVGELEAKGRLSNSQIARLRLVIRKVLRGEESTQIKQFFDDLKKTAREQFDGVRIGKTKLETWIAETIANRHRLNHVVSPKLGGLKVVGDEWESLQLEYHLRLIDGVLVRMAKESQ